MFSKNCLVLALIVLVISQVGISGERDKAIFHCRGSEHTLRVILPDAQATLTEVKSGEKVADFAASDYRLNRWKSGE